MDKYLKIGICPFVLLSICFLFVISFVSRNVFHLFENIVVVHIVKRNGKLRIIGFARI